MQDEHVAAHTRGVGEELAGMTKRKRLDGDNICCNGLDAEVGAGGDPSSQFVRVVGRRCVDDAPSSQQQESPQSSCSVADGILMRQTKKHRIMRRRVSFSGESSMRLVSRELMLAQYFVVVEGKAQCSDGDDEDQENEGLAEGEPGGHVLSSGDCGVRTARDEQEAEGGCTSCAEKRTHQAQGEVHGSGDEAQKDLDDASSSAEDDEAMNVQEECHVEEILLECDELHPFEDVCKDGMQQDSKVVTKTNDGPSLTNVMTQALIMGLVERQVRNVGDVLQTLRQCVVPECFEATAGAEGDELTENDVNVSSSSSKGEASDESSEETVEHQDGGRHKRSRARMMHETWHRRRARMEPRMILEASVFDDAHRHIGVLLERINNNGRASLLPSTAQIGPPFVPALEFLLQSTKEAQTLNEHDRARLGRTSEGKSKAARMA